MYPLWTSWAPSPFTFVNAEPLISKRTRPTGTMCAARNQARSRDFQKSALTNGRMMKARAQHSTRSEHAIQDQAAITLGIEPSVSGQVASIPRRRSEKKKKMNQAALDVSKRFMR